MYGLSHSIRHSRSQAHPNPNPNPNPNPKPNPHPNPNPTLTLTLTRQRRGAATATAAAVEGVGSGGVATPDAPRWENTFETPGCTARPTQEELRSPCSVGSWLGSGLG